MKVKKRKGGYIDITAEDKQDSEALLAWVESMVGKKYRNWFKTRCGKVVLMTSIEGKTEPVLIKDADHAEHLYVEAQNDWGFSFEDVPNEEVSNG